MSRDRQTTSSPRRKHNPGTPSKYPSSSRDTAGSPSASNKNFWKIRGIVEEEIRKGRLWYRIDWEPDPNTAEQYTPTWEPAENANESAVADWKRSKRQGRGLEPSSQPSSLDSDPVPSPNWTAKRRIESNILSPRRKRSLAEDETSPRRKRSRLVQGGANPSSERVNLSEPPNHGQSAKLVVEIAKRSGFDTSEYIPFTSSQLSEYIQSQPPRDSLSQQASLESSVKISQTTIPDSQDFSIQILPDDTNIDLSFLDERPTETIGVIQESPPAPITASANPPALERSDTVPDSQYASATAQQLVSGEDLQQVLNRGASSFGSDIPSHQPEKSQPSRPQSVIGGGQESSSERRSPTKEAGSAVGGTDWSGNLGFLTQADFRFDDTPGESSPRKAAAGTPPRLGHSSESKITDSVGLQTDCSTEKSDSGSASHQAAQIVQPLSSDPPGLTTQSQDFSVYSDGGHQLLQIVQDGSPNKDNSQESSQALSEVDCNIRRTLQETPSRAVSRDPAHDKAATSSQNSDLILQSSEEQHIGHASPPQLRLPVRTPSPSESFHTPNSVAPSTQRTPAPANMETAPATERALSAVEHLKQLQAAAQRKSDISLLSSTEGIAPTQITVVEQPLLSPSAILSSVEAGGAPPLYPARDEPMTSSMQWNAAPEPESMSQLPTSISHTASHGSGTRRQHSMSAAEELQRSLGLGVNFPGNVFGSTIDGINSTKASRPALPGTIAPSDLVTSTESDAMQIPRLPDSQLSSRITATVDQSAPGAHPVDEAYQPSLPNEMPADLETSIVTSINPAENEFVVTLPLAARTRPLYLQIIREHRVAIESFASYFTTTEERKVPDDTLVAKTDLLFERLLDMCDIPPDVEDMAGMSEQAMKKHAPESNSKFFFVLELLEGIRELDKTVMIMARPGRIISFLVSMVDMAGFRFRRLEDNTFRQRDDVVESLGVIIGSTDADASALPDDVDVVIGFDEKSRSSGLLTRYLAPNAYDSGPVVLSLVAAQTLEHIDLRISRTMDPLERKNALVISIFHAMDYIEDRDHDNGLGPPEPDVAADLVCRYIRDPAEDFSWEPHPIPERVFEVYLSQVQPSSAKESSMGPDRDAVKPNGRKRQLDDAEAAEGIPKRLRVSEPVESLVQGTHVQLSDALRAILGNVLKTTGRTAQLSIDQLESLAGRIEDLESRLKMKDTVEEKLRDSVKNLESQVKLYEKTNETIPAAYMQALSDRGVAVASEEAAVKRVEAVVAQLETSKATINGLKADKKELAEKLAAATEALAKSEIPEQAHLASMELKLADATKEAERLNRKLAMQEQNLEYTRAAYQDASKSAADLRLENEELRAQTTDLEARASANLVTLHQINHDAQLAELRRRVQEQASIVRDRDRALELTQDALRKAREGRRETRQQSVPRSPRLPQGVLSPRTGRATSRGTSPGPEAAGAGGGAAPPVPGMAFFGQQSGNGRWGHLMD